MREILFRGKRTDNGEWVEGDLDRGLFANIDFISYFKTIGERLSYEVIPESVSEFTGLCDKNGKKIFEGDILKSVCRWLNMPKNGVVVFRDGAFGFIWYRGDVEMFHPFTSVCNITYEIIGNIHDTPELLKGGTDK